MGRRIGEGLAASSGSGTSGAPGILTPSGWVLEQRFGSFRRAVSRCRVGKAYFPWCQETSPPPPTRTRIHPNDIPGLEVPDVEGLVLDDDPRLTDARSPTAHTHPAEDISGLPDLQGLVETDDPRLTDARTPTTHSHPWSEVTAKPATFPPAIVWGVLLPSAAGTFQLQAATEVAASNIIVRAGSHISYRAV